MVLHGFVSRTLKNITFDKNAKTTYKRIKGITSEKNINVVLKQGLVFGWLHKLRNTQGNIHGTYLGNIYGIYKECITNISIDIYDIR